MTEKQADLIIELLTQIEKNTRPQVAPQWPSPEPKIGQCMHCGGAHGGLPCPSLAPTAR